jgi:hypothetical protein
MITAAIAKFNADAAALQSTEFRSPQTPSEWGRMKNEPRPRDYTKLIEPVFPVIAAFRAAAPAERAGAGAKLTLDAREILGNFAHGMAVLSVRQESPAFITQGLIALAIVSNLNDPRDLCFFLATLYHSAEKLGIDAPKVFADAATLVPSEDFRNWMRHFPLRPPEARALSAFLLREVNTDEGYDVVSDAYSSSYWIIP